MNSETLLTNMSLKRERAVHWLYVNREILVRVMMLVFIVALAVLTVSKPIYEWDLFAYLGNAMQITTNLPIEELHQRIYATVEAALPSVHYERLVGESPSRLILSQDSEAYQQTIAFFYDARIIYIHILAALFSTGIDPVFAIYAFSTFCTILSYLLLSRFIPVAVPMGMHIVLPFIVLAFGLMDVARLATPDSLAALVTIVLYMLLLRDKLKIILLLAPFVVFIRTDLIVLLAIFHAYLLFGGRVSRVLVILSGVATIAAYVVLNNVIIDPDPWSSLMGYNFGEKPTHTEDYVFPVSISDYLGYLYLGVFSFSYTPLVFVFMVTTISALVLLSARYITESGRYTFSRLHKDLLFVVVSGAVYFALHLMLFPVTWIRFFAPQYSITAVVLCWCMFALLSSQHKNEQVGLGFLSIK